MNLEVNEGMISRVIVGPETASRLTHTCFRGRWRVCAGNFFAWNTLADFLHEKSVLSSLLASAKETLLGGGRANAVCLEFDQLVGWTSTDDVVRYRPRDLENFNPNERCVAVRVKPSLRNLLAPVTSLATITYKVADYGPFWMVIVYSAYPGPDIGKLRGPVSSASGRVFFDWNHPGAPLPSR